MSMRRRILIMPKASIPSQRLVACGLDKQNAGKNSKKYGILKKVF